MAHWAERYLTVPFVDGGRSVKGADCWGLVCTVYRECLGITLPVYGDIGAEETLRIRRAMKEGVVSGTWRRVSDPVDFDVAGMLLPNGERLGHVGIVVSGYGVLHTEKAGGAMIEDLKSATLRNRIVGYWRHESRCP